MSELKKIGEALYEIAKTGKMKVPGLIVTLEEMIEEEGMERPLDQVRNVATLPGIEGYSIAMPDIHWGYGFPIGGVAATDMETGVISPGGVGYDINCGVRLALAPISFKKISPTVQHNLLSALFKLIPSGVGHGQDKRKELTEHDYREIVEKGVRFSIERGYGFSHDIEHIESLGMLDGGNLDAVSVHAKERGKNQLGSIGSGNHFVEIGEVGEILDEKIAKKWKVDKEQTYILIHTGSRGFGHQICQDTLDEFVEKGFADHLDDKQLVYAPIKSADGQKYLQAMHVAANYAFNNRQQILHGVRLAFKDVLNINPEEIKLLYDVCHNIAKFEEHVVNGKKKKLCVHRKGATRAFGPHHSELAKVFQETGQPVLVPGDMQRCSYLMAGLGNPITWCSSCHGAGRARSRIKSRESWKGRDPVNYMKEQGIQVMASSFRTIAEEMPDAYKDVNLVVKATQMANLAKMVAKLLPRLVIKG